MNNEYSNDWVLRSKVIEQGRDKDLDILVNDENNDVLRAVAKIGRDKDLDKLVHDENKDVSQLASEKIAEKRRETIKSRERANLEALPF